IIDELGRGTSVEEGVGFCFAICEQLLQTKALTLFATHFTEMTKLEDFYYNVSNFHFGVNHSVIDEINTNSYTFTHVLEAGATQEVLYGLQLANMTAIDPIILHNAEVIAQQLLQTFHKSIVTTQMDSAKRAKYRLTSMLKSLSSDGQIPDVEALNELLIKYQTDIQSGTQDDSQMENDFSLI
ncbi:unnamed protein product, partial [Medioppia subpectinata]